MSDVCTGAVLVLFWFLTLNIRIHMDILVTIRHNTSKSFIYNSFKQKNAPDIHNDDYFPVLGAGGKRAGGWSTAGGAGGGAAGTPRADTRQPLALGNRFTSLQDDS